MDSNSIYIQVNIDGKSLGVWTIEGNTVVRVGVADPMSHPNTHVQREAGETFEEAMSRKLSAWFGPEGSCTLHKIELGIGEYYPKIARPRDQHPKDIPTAPPLSSETEQELASSRDQLVMLMQRMVQICQTLHPCTETFDAFGHEVRNVIILACTEVETLWRSVLVANGYKRPRYDTNDYVKLVKPMRLREYAISFPYYPWLEAVKPFEKWGTSNSPTKDLEWYSAYHAIKHDRHSNFADSKLRYAFEAISACAVMLFAQFGKPEAFRWRAEFGYFFQLAAYPKFDPSEVYVEPYGVGAKGWKPKHYPFS